MHAIFDNNYVDSVRDDVLDDEINNLKKINLKERVDDSLPKE